MEVVELVDDVIWILFMIFRIIVFENWGYLGIVMIWMVKGGMYLVVLEGMRGFVLLVGLEGDYNLKISRFLYFV